MEIKRSVKREALEGLAPVQKLAPFNAEKIQNLFISYHYFNHIKAPNVPELRLFIKSLDTVDAVFLIPPFPSCVLALQTLVLKKTYNRTCSVGKTKSWLNIVMEYHGGCALHVPAHSFEQITLKKTAI